MQSLLLLLRLLLRLLLLRLPLLHLLQEFVLLPPVLPSSAFLRRGYPLVQLAEVLMLVTPGGLPSLREQGNPFATNGSSTATGCTKFMVLGRNGSGCWGCGFCCCRCTCWESSEDTD